MVNPKTLPQELEEKLGEIEKERIEQQAKDIANKNNLAYINIATNPIDPEALSLIEEEESKTAQAGVISKEGKKLKTVVVDPKNPETQKLTDRLAKEGFSLNLGVVSVLGMQKVWNKYKELSKQTEEKIGTISIDTGIISETQKEIKNISDLKEKIGSISTTNLLEILLGGAIKVEASDIHMEPEEKSIRLRYRIDGVLNDVTEIKSESYNKILARIKINSGLKLNIHNTPQDGRFTVSFKNKDIEIRTSVLPGAYGENTVMRILDPKTIRQNIEDLGMTPENFTLIKKLLQKTTGSILTTGPTGSGKTTTLYAFIRHVNEPGLKIITIEDPVEYHIEGISQTQVSPAKGYTFASGLRSIVRQDPDVILVGEIRDGETAEIAMQAALTGHLVFSTLHTNDAAGAIPRLIDLGIKPVMIAPALNAVLAQRLVRKLCPECKKKDTVSKEEYENIKEAFADLSDKNKIPKTKEDTEIFRPGKCIACNFTGYKGRIGVFEIFLIDDEIERLILKSPAISDVKEAALKKGMITMLQDGYFKVLEGITSIEEVRRVLS
ncbi:MAG: type II/IV secretion system protein [Candidatus Yanofskybacteria bacterium]|nr:type II/IV secretion system protein [Candidatus Yanofskybacteria bacterium]